MQFSDSTVNICFKEIGKAIPIERDRDRRD